MSRISVTKVCGLIAATSDPHLFLAIGLDKKIFCLTSNCKPWRWLSFQFLWAQNFSGLYFGDVQHIFQNVTHSMLNLVHFKAKGCDNRQGKSSYIKNKTLLNSSVMFSLFNQSIDHPSCVQCNTCFFLTSVLNYKHYRMVRD